MSFDLNKKKKIRDLIFTVEENSDETGSIAQTYHSFADKLKKRKSPIANIFFGFARKLKLGAKRSDIYQPYLSKNMINFLKLLDYKYPLVGVKNLFRDFGKADKKAEETLSSLRNQLVTPIFVFLFAVFGLNFTLVDTFRKIVWGDEHNGNPIVKVNYISEFILEHYIVLNLAFLGIILFLLITFHKKIPILRDIFKGIEIFLIISQVKYMYLDLKASATDIIKSVANAYGYKKYTNSNYHGINKILYYLRNNKLIDIVDEVKLEEASKRGEAKTEEALRNIVVAKEREIEKLQDTIKKFASNFSITITVVPIMMALYVMFTVIMALSIYNSNSGY